MRIKHWYMNIDYDLTIKAAKNWTCNKKLSPACLDLANEIVRLADGLKISPLMHEDFDPMLKILFCDFCMDVSDETCGGKKEPQPGVIYPACCRSSQL